MLGLIVAAAAAAAAIALAAGAGCDPPAPAAKPAAPPAAPTGAPAPTTSAPAAPVAIDASAGPAGLGSRPTPDWSRLLGGAAGCIEVVQASTGEVVRNDAARCAQRLRPFSTFKIPNALIGLETGVVQDAETVLRADPKLHPPDPSWRKEWQGEHTLRSAVEVSCFPWFQELARRVGAERMRDWVHRLGYGNESIEGTKGAIDDFWVRGKLAISADEQIAFLRKLHDGALPVSPRAAAIVTDIIAIEKTPKHTLRGKTGSGRVDDGRWLGWLVGWVETADDVYYFAVNLDGTDWETVRDGRISAARGALAALRIID
jgi:beta-lactamase class D